MKNKFIWLGLSFLLVAAMLLASCATSTTSTPTSTTTNTVTTKSTTTTTKTTTPPTTATTTTTTTTTGNWWDSLGTPQYGGTITLRSIANPVAFDPYQNVSYWTIEAAYMEKLTEPDWTVDPSVFNFKLILIPSQFEGTGGLAKSWEMPDASDYVVHLNQGVHFQNIPPVNGRELVASDIVDHYDRLWGLGNGYTTPDPLQPSAGNWAKLQSVTANGDYTVDFKWNSTNPQLIVGTMQGDNPYQNIEAPETVAQWGNLNDWHHAIGTGPFILTDFVSGSSATLIRNTNYWGHDERYPQNPLPYADNLRILIISDNSTAMSAVRTGKIDLQDKVNLQDAAQMKTTNPEIVQIPIPNSNTFTINPRNDIAPFNDVKVREALQMAVNLPELAQDYYGGLASPDPSTLTSNYLTGWGFPYSQWPQDLKDQYAFNIAKAKELLTEAGHPNGFTTECVADNAGDLDLLQIVKGYFATINVTMNITRMDDTAWQSYVTLGHKQTALAYGQAGVIGRTFDPIIQLTLFLSTSPTNPCGVNDPTYDAFYPAALNATSIDQVKKIVSDCNLYVAQQHYAISLLQANFFGFSQPWLKGFNGQFGAGGVNNNYEIGFFVSRFWIDQSVKNSK